MGTTTLNTGNSSRAYLGLSGFSYVNATETSMAAYAMRVSFGKCAK